MIGARPISVICACPVVFTMMFDYMNVINVTDEIRRDHILP